VLADGSEFELSAEEAREVYEELWGATGVRGALTAAAKVNEAQRLPVAHRVHLSREESNLVRALLAKVRAPR
jgi:hypothetical protein